MGVVVGGRGSKISELQLSGNPDHVHTIIQEAGPDGRRRMKCQLVVDYVFLFLYWLTFVGLAILIARRGGAGYESVAFLSLVAASLTSLLDVLENVRTEGVLALSRPGDQVRLQPVEHLRRTSLFKWAASATTVALLSVAFLPGATSLVLLGAGFLVLAAICLLGLRWNGWIRVYLLLFFALGGVIAVWFTFWSGGVVNRL